MYFFFFFSLSSNDSDLLLKELLDVMLKTNIFLSITF